MPIIDRISQPTSRQIPAYFSTQIREASRFVLPAQPRKAQALAVICGGLEVCDAAFCIDRKSFPYMAIEFVAAGQGTVDFADQQFRLSPGSLFCYGPGDPHRIRTDPKNTLVKYFVDFTCSSRDRRLRQLLPVRNTRSQIGDIASLSRLFEELIHWGGRDVTCSSPICAAILSAILHAVQELRLESGERDGRAFERYQRCRRILESAAMRIRSLGDLSAECGISREYLCRLFHRFDGMSPYQRLLRARMNHAAVRLRQPGILVKDVANELGFSDPFHFSRTFQSCFKVPPSRFAAR